MTNDNQDNEVSVEDEPLDSSADWVVKHTHRYIESDGADGYMFYGAPTLVLTTIGRRSGKPRRTMLIFGEDAGRYMVVASVGGASEHPLWYFNLLDNPEVLVQIKADRFHARARVAGAAEKPQLWQKMAAIWPAYNQYQKKTSREIPVVILERK